MVIIKTPETSNVNVPSRTFDAGLDVDLTLYNESSEVTTATTVTATYTNGVMGFNYDFGGNEGQYYYVIMAQSSSELVKFKMFCTNQTDLQNFKITEGDFTNAPDSPDVIHTVE